MPRNNEEDPPRVLGLDPGGKRTGIAVSDPLGITAQGLETFVVTPKMALPEYVEKLAGEYNIKTVVIGMPLSMSGKEIEGSERSRTLASSIKERIDAEIVFVDERMTSLESERLLRSAGGVRDKGNIDKISAVLILQSYLDGVDRR